MATNKAFETPLKLTLAAPAGMPIASTLPLPLIAILNFGCGAKPFRLSILPLPEISTPLSSGVVISTSSS